MRKTKCFVAFILAVLLLCLTGCGAGSDTTAPDTSTALQKAEQHIQEGDLKAAYDLLLAIEEPSEEEKDLLAGFRFLPDILDYAGTTVRYTYDEKGNCMKEETRENIGRFRTTEYTYDGVGRVRTKTFVGGEDQNSVINQIQTEYTYDDKDNILTQKSVENGKEELVTNTYDEKGRLLSRTIVRTGEYTNTITYTYDARNYLVLEQSSTAYTDGKTGQSRVEYTYDDTSDENRRVHTKQSISPNGEGPVYTYIYDAAGNLLEESYRYDVGPWQIKEYTYDLMGNQITHKYRSGDSSDIQPKYWYHETYIYDEDNKMTMETSVNQNCEGQVVLYTYDDYGNCVKKEFTSNGYLVTQTFTYKLFYNPKWAEE